MAESNTMLSNGVKFRWVIWSDWCVMNPKSFEEQGFDWTKSHVTLEDQKYDKLNKLKITDNNWSNFMITDTPLLVRRVMRNGRPQ